MKTNLKLLSATGLLFIITAGGIKAQVEKLPTSGNMGLEHIPVWLTSGNTGNNPNIQFLGTIDNQALVFRTNNIARMWITNTGNIGIGTSSPSAKLQVTGGDAIINGITIGRGKGAGVANTAAGDQALFSNTTGFGNTALGDYVLYHNTSGRQNTGNGTYSLFYNTTGVANTANGMESLVSNTTGNHNTATGYNALSRNTTGNYNIANGSYTLNANTTGSYNTALGYFSFPTGAAFSNSTAIGANAAITASNQVRLGDGNVASLFCIGAYTATTTIAPNMYVSANGQIMRSTAGVGSGGWGLTGNAGTIDGTNFIGTTDNVPFNIRVNNQMAGRIDQFKFNTFYGYLSGFANTTGINNTANGYLALSSNTTGLGNTANGHLALLSNTTGVFNTANGRGALQANTTGSNNTAYGANAMSRNTTGEWNTALGENGLQINTTGSYNTGSGFQTLVTNTTGNSNTALGYFADVTSGNLTNATAIGYNVKVNASNQVRLGDNNVTSLYSMGAYASTTSIAPNMYVSATGQIMRSTTGVGGGGWGLTGNAGTIDGVNFIGTTDNVPFNIRVNNQKAGRIDHLNANTFFGFRAGNSNISGSFNTAFGNGALLLNTHGSQNTATGDGALSSNTTGGQNTATGNSTLVNNTTGVFNTATGFGALSSNTTGDNNTASGDFALNSNTIGIFNTALGSKALIHNIRGDHNTATGVRALMRNTTGVYNTATGIDALQSNSFGAFNTAIGSSAMNHVTTGGENVGIGGLAGGTSNPSFSTFLGSKTNAILNATNNVTAIGYEATATASNQVRIGNTSVTSIGGQVNWTVFSDGRYKKNLNEDVPGLAFITKLRPVTYNLDVEGIDNKLKANLPPVSTEGHSELAKAIANQKPSVEQAKAKTEKAKIKYTGFVAQEVEAIAKKLNYDFSGVDAPKNKEDFYGLRYSEFVVPLVKAVQELSNKNDALQLENEALKDRLDKIEQRLTANSKTFENISSARLEQNAPNPYKGNTIINYYVPFNAGNAVIKITDMKGSLLKIFNVKEGKGQVILQSDQLAAGTYQYSLFVNGRLIDTKQMLLIR